MQNRFKFRFWDDERNTMLYPNENNEYIVDDLKVDLGKILNLSGKLNSRFRAMQNTGLTKCDLYEQDIVEVTIDKKKVIRIITYYSDLAYYYYLIVDSLEYYYLSISNWIYDGYLIGNFYEGRFKEKMQLELI